MNYNLFTTFPVHMNKRKYSFITVRFYEFLITWHGEVSLIASSNILSLFCYDISVPVTYKSSQISMVYIKSNIGPNIEFFHVSRNGTSAQKELRSSLIYQYFLVYAFDDDHIILSRYYPHYKFIFCSILILHLFVIFNYKNNIVT